MPHADAPRTAGMLIPLFSVHNGQSWGIGEIADVLPLAEWLAEAGHGLLQLLPINEVSPGETSPYGSASGFAIDPIYISLREVEDFEKLGGERALSTPLRTRLEGARAAGRVQYEPIRALKRTALRACFQRFEECERAAGSARALDFARFREEHDSWLRDYGLFRALHDRFQAHWESWPEPLRSRELAALESEREVLRGEIRYYEYVQWLAEGQWQAARRAANRIGVRIKGDLPFMVSGHSADVWACQQMFRKDTEAGAPPDAFSAEGQNWRLPPYDWEAMAADDFRWLRRRAGRAAQLYDLFRVDHVVGFFRSYNIPKDGSRAFFLPGEEPAQIALGEQVMRVFQASGAEVLAEDLGVIPRFVRRSLTALGIPGYRVLRWEKEWDEPGQPYRDPAHYPELSIAVSATHDTETLAAWWEGSDTEERRAVCRIPAMRELNSDAAAKFSPVVHHALLETLYSAGSRYLVLPEQDIFGRHDRINVPALVSPENWTYRMPLSLSELRSDPRGREASGRMALCAQRHGRWLGGL